MFTTNKLSMIETPKVTEVIGNKKIKLVKRAGIAHNMILPIK